MLKQSCIYSVIAGFIFLFGFNWLYHGIVLAGAYEATADMWRTPAEMKEYFWWCVGSQALLVVVLASLYDKMKCCSGIQGGVCFGFLAGLVIAILDGRSYIYMPLPESLAVAWVIGGVVSGVGLGIIFSYFKSCCATTCCSSDQSCSMPVAAPAPVKKKAPAKKRKTAKKKKK